MMYVKTEEKKGFKRTEAGLIPEDWDLIKIGDVLDFKNGLNKAKKYFGEGTPIINYMDVFKYPGLFEDLIKGKVTLNRDEKRRFNVEKGDVFFTRTSETVEEIGISSVLEEDIEDGVYSGFVLRGRPVDDKLSLKFKRYCFSSETVRKQIISSATYTTRALTNGRHLSKVKLPLPPTLEEQQAIASALSDVDELIRSLDRLIEKKEAIKKGTMQQLLTGKKRLPGFDGEWEVKKLGDMLMNSPDYGINAPAMEYNSNYPTYLRITDISKNGRFIKEEKKSVKAPNSDLYYLNEGEIVLARTGASTGKSYHYNSDDGVLVFAGFLIRVKPNSKKLFSHFLKYFLQTDGYWNWVNSNSMRSGQPGLNSMQYSSLEIPTPPLGEQKAIAQILTDLDQELQTLRQKRDKYKQVKQGMMQELLTGKTRLI